MCEREKERVCVCVSEKERETGIVLCVYELLLRNRDSEREEVLEALRQNIFMEKKTFSWFHEQKCQRNIA